MSRGLKPDTAALVAAFGLTFPAAALTDDDVADEYLRAVRGAALTTRTDEPIAEVEERLLASGLRVRVYVPEGPAGKPIVVYLHGGGWVSGDLDMHDSTCRRIANRAGCVVVNVDYRLAPEHPFPQALNDAQEALRWAGEHGAEFSGDPSLIAVAGTSAGANLAAALTLDEGHGPRPSLQVLVYPVLDSRMGTPSFREFATGYLISSDQLRWYWDQYVPTLADREDPRASPSLAPSLGRVPPAVIVTAEYDPLRDEAEEYARALEREGVPVQLVRYEGQVHGFFGMLGTLEDAAIAVDDVADRISEHFGRRT